MLRQRRPGIKHWRKALFLCLAVVVGSTVPAHAVLMAKFRSSTNQARWVAETQLQIQNYSAQANEVNIDTGTKYQTWEGWGGSPNEVGMASMHKLSAAQQDSVAKMIYDTVTGCKFNWIRLPIGASDFSINCYTLNDNAGDTLMTKINIDRDKPGTIAFCKSAMKFNPALKVWGSPWTAPIWMKAVNNCWGPSNDPNSDQCAVNQNPSILRAYALYFSKAVSLYKAEGLPFFALSFQNELRVCQPFPSTRWTGATGRDFMNNYLAPKMKADHPDVQLWTPTMNVADVTNYFAPMLDGCKDIVATCFQYEGEQVMAQVHTRWPNIKTYATELACGGGDNSWDYPLSQTFGEIKRTITDGGVSGVCQWNLVLDKSYSSGSFVNFKQNCMITIDSVAKTYTLQTQYYGLKHFSYYIRPGAKILKVSGSYANSAVPAKNPSGSIAVVTENNSGSAKTVAVHWGNQMVSAQLPAYSFGSFLISDSLTTGTMPNVHGMPAKSLIPVNRIFTIASGKPGLPNEFLGKVCQGAIFNTKGRLIREFSGYVGYGAKNANLLGDLKSAQGVYIVQVKAVLQ